MESHKVIYLFIFYLGWAGAAIFLISTSYIARDDRHTPLRPAIDMVDMGSLVLFAWSGLELRVS
jgi:hypothetical protein